VAFFSSAPASVHLNLDGVSGQPCRAILARSRSTPAAISLTTNKHLRSSSVLEDVMTSAAQALLLTAGLFGLSFFAIFAVWYAERLRYGAAGKLPL
jgi:hypothetical protein